MILSYQWLVGGWTNPIEKYARQIGSFPQVGVNIKKKIFETNHHPNDIILVTHWFQWRKKQQFFIALKSRRLPLVRLYHRSPSTHVVGSWCPHPRPGEPLFFRLAVWGVFFLGVGDWWVAKLPSEVFACFFGKHLMIHSSNHFSQRSQQKLFKLK